MHYYLKNNSEKALDWSVAVWRIAVPCSRGVFRAMCYGMCRMV